MDSRCSKDRLEHPIRSRAASHRAWRDSAAVVIAGLAFLCTTYWLINENFVYIYLSGAIYAAALAYFVSFAWLRNSFVCATAVLGSLTVGELLLNSIAVDDNTATLRENHRYTRGYSEPLRSNGGPLGYTPFPSRAVKAWKTVGSERIYDVIYTIDQHGLRATPSIKRSSMAPAFVFFGDSFVFGEGLNDEETLPSYFAKELAFAHPVVNFAFSGYGSHQMLRSIELGMLDEVVSGPIQAAVYVALPDHVKRAAGEVWWDPVGPKYEMDSQGMARYVGPFTRVPEPLIPAFYKVLQTIELARRSLIIDRLADLMVNDREGDLQSQVRTFTGIVARASDLLKERYGAHLYVVYWDDGSTLSDEILASLDASDLSVVKMSDIIPLEKRKVYTIPKDGHPTGAANAVVAKVLSKRILGHNEGVGGE